MNVDKLVLEKFEEQLNPSNPDKSGIQPRILGYGEISTTFSLSDMPDIAFKRMPPFHNPDEIRVYQSAVDHYCNLLSDKCGIKVSGYAFFSFINPRNEHILYVAQPRLEAETIGNNILKSGNQNDLAQMLSAVIDRLVFLFKFNCENAQNKSIGLDAQISNWSFPSLDPINISPVYFDITTPLFRINGKDQLDTEIFLKSCPSFLVWLVRWQFLQEVLDRYYDVRMILIDFVANFHKEDREDLIDYAILMINQAIENNALGSSIAYLKKDEVDRYYKNDAFIWALFLSLRRFDRFLKTKLFRQPYNFILPGKITR